MGRQIRLSRGRNAARFSVKKMRLTIRRYTAILNIVHVEVMR